MINFILFVTVLVFWLGAVYLYFVLSILQDVFYFQMLHFQRAFQTSPNPLDEVH